jgi:23S rRNA (adenine2030-N6)-methyltransferase
MNYRHSFHAGNYGDVFKHALLVGLMRALQRKEKGFLYLDTHAGRGAYDLLAPPMPEREGRPPEWPQGIGRLWEATDLPPLLAEYVALVRMFNERTGGRGGRLRFYPGSPWFAALVQRPQDRLVLWEQRDEEAGALRAELARHSRVTVACSDGYGALRAVLPPPERRALVLIDPPFEDKDELDAVLGALRDGLKRFPAGVYAVWHPVTERVGAEAFRAALQALKPPPTLSIELLVTADPRVRCKGCGLLVINPPWRFAEEMQPVMPVFASRLGVDSGATMRLEWLVPKT